MIRHERVGIIFVFLDDEMALLLDLLTVVPLHGAPPKLSEEGVIPVPRLKVESTPHAAFLRPKCTHALKDVAACVDGRVNALEALVVFLDLLRGGQKGMRDRRGLTLRPLRRSSRVAK